MKSLWNDAEAAQFVGGLAQRVYTSRLLGCEPALVLHGGGNTSVKIREKNIFGEDEDILYVKGSGWDLETIEVEGFAPVRLNPLLRLAKLESLSDTQMVSEFKTSLTNPSAPMPSVEAILHALLPAKFVDHTHADAVISVMNAPNGLARVQEIYGDQVVIIPYVMPGFKLARLCAELFPKHAGPQTVGMALMHHGLFTFGDTARDSYQLMIELVTRAEEYLAKHGAWSGGSVPSQRDPYGKGSVGIGHIPLSPSSPYGGVSPPPEQPMREQIAALRREVSEAAGAPMIMTTHCDAQCLGFAQRDDVSELALQGAATPDHVIRTKRVPMVGRDVHAYRKDYENYFAMHSQGRELTMVDPAPRVILDRELGLCALGRSVNDAIIAGDIYRHTIDIILRSAALGGWRALPEQDMFDMEYWELQQAKLKLPKSGPLLMLTGEVALVTGAASGIGRACVESFLSRGAAVVALDISENITRMFKPPDALCLRCDITNEEDVARSMETAVKAFGGLDMLMLNAGIFPPSCRIDALSLADWDRVMRVNLDANLTLMREMHPLLKLAPRGGRVVVIGSKNVPAPGPGAAAYSASKAALNQLARVAALEWGADGIRVNVLHPNAVFDTGIWTEEVLQKRAANYGMTVEQYKTNNVLRTEVTSHDVAELAAELCGPLFAKTTGAQIPVDGGNERVI